jgi:hypothetical protein
MRRLSVGSSVAAAIALAIGVGIGYVDSRPTWDDTGITVAVVVLSAGALALVRPRSWWVTGLLVGTPTPIFNYLAHRNVNAVAALVFALVAAAIGGLIGKFVSTQDERRVNGHS